MIYYMHMPDPTRYELGGIQFTWNTVKHDANVLKHGVTFEEAATTWLDPSAIERASGASEEWEPAGRPKADQGRIESFDEAHSIDEDRWFRIGKSLLRGAVLVTWSAGDILAGQDRIRIIGARAATRKERRLYEKEKR